ncbi:MAG: phasin family protein [Caulobacterales bacterium]
MPIKETNGAPTVTDFATLIFATPGFHVSQKLALEAARFSAQRMRAFADQVETLASCKNPGDLMSAQTKYIKQLSQDLVAESQTMRDIIATPASAA